MGLTEIHLVKKPRRLVLLTTLIVVNPLPSATLDKSHDPGRSRPCAGGAISLLGGDEPFFLVYRPAAVRLLHLGKGGCIHPTDLVGLADIHL